MQTVCLKWQVQGSNGLGFWYCRCSTVVPAMVDSIPVSQAIAISSTVLLFLFNSNRALEVHTAEEVDEDDAESLFPCLTEGNHNFTEVDQTTSAAIHHMWLFSVFAIFGEDLGYWVKPRSTMWFSRFFLE
jgi:hypothetical protein